MECIEGITGVWVDGQGKVHLALAEGVKRRETLLPEPCRPFVWTSGGGEGTEALAGDGVLTGVRFFQDPAAWDLFQKETKDRKSFDTVRLLENHYLLQTTNRYFTGMSFGQLRRLQLDIETGNTDGGFSDARNAGDRVLAIGLRIAGQPEYLVLEEDSDEGERRLLLAFNERLQALDPDIIEGHNLFRFDLDYLRIRGKRLKVPCQWGRFGQTANFRPSRMRVAERWIDFPRCDLPGRTVFDTWLAVQLYDITARELPGYGLKTVALFLGITPDEAGARTYVDGSDISRLFREDRSRFLAYLGDDLKETEGLADLLLPTYIAQALNFPLTLQEICLRGTANKVESLFLEKYFHARQALPEPEAIGPYEGGFTKSFAEGVFKGVLHFDVASLYPSILLHLGRNPRNDTLGIFIPLLEELRTYRLEFKKKARETDDPQMRQEYQARQASYKILINSFYGYLGFGGGRFADGDLAAEVTRQGRDLLRSLIERFQQIGCTVLEADTDGIYLASETYFKQPETLLEKVCDVLPEGIELEYDGSYEAMFCYKAKNYAVYDGKQVKITGSALRSRGTEPYLKELTDCLIYHLLGASPCDLKEKLATVERDILEAGMPVEKLARAEYLSMRPEQYSKAVETAGKSRRASLEVALQMNPVPGMGEQVQYYITPGEKKRSPDWQTARPLSSFDPASQPYDPDYYLRKLEDWKKRYAAFIPQPESGTQGELALF